MGSRQSKPSPAEVIGHVTPVLAADTMHAELLCPVCGMYYDNVHLPRCLPNCDHVVCEKCIPNIIKTSRIEESYQCFKNDGKVTCPKCQAKIDPKDYPPKNYRINRELLTMAEREKQQNAGKQFKRYQNKFKFITMRDKVYEAGR